MARTPVYAPATNDVYVGMLGLTALAMLMGICALALDATSYGWESEPKGSAVLSKKPAPIEYKGPTDAAPKAAAPAEPMTKAEPAAPAVEPSPAPPAVPAPAPVVAAPVPAPVPPILAPVTPPPGVPTPGFRLTPRGFGPPVMPSAGDPALPPAKK